MSLAVNSSSAVNLALQTQRTSANEDLGSPAPRSASAPSPRDPARPTQPSATAQIDAQSDQLVAAQNKASAVTASVSPPTDDDSARLLALQVQQSLSTQTASISNPSSKSILALFRN